MLEDLFEALTRDYRPGVFSIQRVFYFSVDELKKTITLGPEGCKIEEGKTVAEADCVLKTSADFLEKIWLASYRPSALDFMAGRIKTNAPELLQQFLKAFGR